jgi:hypothetical protein
MNQVELFKECSNSLKYIDGTLFWENPSAPRLTKGDLAGWEDNRGYRRIQLGERTYLTHRLVFLMHHGYLPKIVDHIDGDRLNNKIENLREVTPSQSSCNIKTRVNSISGVKGVTWRKDRNRWIAKITYQGKVYHVGLYKDVEDAEKAIQERRSELHGEYART